MKTSSLYKQTATFEGFLGGCAVYSLNMSRVKLRMSPFKNAVRVFSTVIDTKQRNKRQDLKEKKRKTSNKLLFPNSFKTMAASSSLTVLHCAIVTFVPFRLRFQDFRKL